MFDRYFTEQEEKQLFKTVSSFKDILARRDDALMRLLRSTGIRVGSLVRLTVGDARQALQSDYLHYTGKGSQGKGPKAGKVLVTKKARQALIDLLSIRKKQGHPDLQDAQLIMSRENRGITIRQIENRVRFWANAAGIEGNVSPHWFRHTVGKRIMKNSSARDPRGVAKSVLNHSSFNSTSIYTEADKEEVERTMREIA